MARFRSSSKQVEYVIGRRLALGAPRHRRAVDGLIHSVGTARAYSSALQMAAQWLKSQGFRRGLDKMPRFLAERYLAERAKTVTQKTLDLDRQALNQLFDRNLPVIRSEAAHGRLGRASRAYRTEQILLIRSQQSEDHGFATAVVAATGIRAHELITLRPASERPPTSSRPWSDGRFRGITGERYTVIGKGGLVREVMVPVQLAIGLELRRQTESSLTDRNVHYATVYDLPKGQAWSQHFTQTSTRLFGWSLGGHGLRHRYAQKRMQTLQALGITYQSALMIVSQELGHFRPDITETYLR